MAVTISTEALLRAPELFVQNKKPVGPVKIDWSHPLSRGMIGCWLFQNNNGLDLTANHHGTRVGTGIYAQPTTAGMAVYNPTNNTTDRFNLGSITSSDKLSGVPTGQLSCFVYAEVQESGNSLYPRWIDKSSSGSATNGWAFYYDVQSDGLYYSQAGSNVSAASLTPYYDGKPHGFSFSVEPGITTGVELWVYIDGENVLSKGAGVSPVLNVFPTTTTNAALLNWNHTGDRQCYTPVYYIYLWDRTLSAAEHKSLSSDAYQFLVPA